MRAILAGGGINLLRRAVRELKDLGLADALATLPLVEVALAHYEE